ncbi:MAG: hypothetical protein V1772_08590, partial [Chloroflexota bacterium]
NLAPTSAQTGAELLRNGGFEREPDGEWSFPRTPARGRRTLDAHHSGDWSALLGLRPDDADVFSYSTAHQKVAIPRDAWPVTLSFWYLAGTQEAANASAAAVRWEGYAPLRLADLTLRAAADEGLWLSHDWQRALVLNASYGVEQVLWTTCETSGGWTYAQYDLTRYAGRTIVVYFEVLNNGAGGRPTHLFLDQVSLAVGSQTRAWLPIIVVGER